MDNDLQMDDRSWMYRRHVSGVKGVTLEFREGVAKFVTFACGTNLDTNLGEIRCPCLKCKNCKFQPAHIVRTHLYQKGFVNNYYNWTCHGEPFIPNSSIPTSQPNTSTSVAIDHMYEFANPFRDMVFDAAGPTFQEELQCSNLEEPPNPEAQKFYKMLQAADTPLWDGCTSQSQLSVTARLLNIKSEHNMSIQCFDELLSLFKESMPSGSKLADGFYNMKKLVLGLGLPVQKIDVCINGCMLYWKDDIDRRQCRFCFHDRYRHKRKISKNHSRKEVPYKRMHYLPLTPRLQRLYASNATAQHMRWHKDSQQVHDEMCHPRDGEAWKHFDNTYPDFASESRNVRLGLCTDGFSPFGMSGKQYSCWPVIVTPYNLPPWMCMKKSVLFLTLLVPGPKNPKHKLDVYLQPLIEELIQLWNEGVNTYDISLRQNFQMRAALM